MSTPLIRYTSSVLRISDLKTMQLLEEYKKEECLWNTYLDDYPNRAKRAIAAEKIAKKLDIPNFEAFHVLFKFKNLRNSYCQELKKLAHAEETGETYKPKVVWFKLMDSFIKPHLQTSRNNGGPSKKKARKMKQFTEVNILNNEVTSESIKTESDDEEMEHQDDWTVSQDQIAITDGCEEVYSDQSTEAILPVEQHLLEAHQTSQPQGIEIEVERKNEDYFDNFGKYIVSMLRSLPAHAALTLQPKIVNLIVQEIEKQNFQDNNDS